MFRERAGRLAQDLPDVHEVEPQRPVSQHGVLHEIPQGHRVQLRNQGAGVVGILAALLEQGGVVREVVEIELPVRVIAQLAIGVQ